MRSREEFGVFGLARLEREEQGLAHWGKPKQGSKAAMNRRTLKKTKIVLDALGEMSYSMASQFD
jgi:hypothetical protein